MHDAMTLTYLGELCSMQYSEAVVVEVLDMSQRSSPSLSHDDIRHGCGLPLRGNLCGRS